MNVRALTTAAVLLLAVPLAGCGSSSGGGSGSNADNDKAVKSLSAEFTKNSSSDLSFNKKQADCFSKGIVDKVGVKNLQKYQILTKDLKANDSINNIKMNKTDADAAAGVLVGCIDLKAVFLKSMGSETTIPAAAKTCIEKAISNSTLKSLMSAEFQGQDSTAAQAKLEAPLMKCMTAAVGQ